MTGAPGCACCSKISSSSTRRLSGASATAPAPLALHPLDGATIKPVLDAWGAPPRPFAQDGALVYPVPISKFQRPAGGRLHRRDILYRPRNPRAHAPMVFPVEQIIAERQYRPEAAVPSARLLHRGQYSRKPDRRARRLDARPDQEFPGLLGPLFHRRYGAAAAREIRPRRRRENLHPDQGAGAEKRLRRMDRARCLLRLLHLAAALRQSDESLDQRDAEAAPTRKACCRSSRGSSGFATMSSANWARKISNSPGGRKWSSIRPCSGKISSPM